MAIQRIQTDATLVGTSKTAKVIDAKIRNSHLSLKEISKIVHCSHAHARRVWAEHQKAMLHRRGSPRSPYSVHGSWKENEVPVHWLNGCPLDVSKNRNGQRLFKGKRMTLLFHRNGKVMVYAYSEGWDQEVKEFLGSFWNEDQIEGFMASLEDRGSKAVAFDTPNVPKNFKVRVKGFGFLHTDTTPYPDGTTEFEYDPELLKRMDVMDARLQRLEVYAEKQLQVSEKLGTFAERQLQVSERQVLLSEKHIEAIKENTEALGVFNKPRPLPTDRSVV